MLWNVIEAPLYTDKYIYMYICHGRKSNLVEFEILLVESPMEVSTSRNSNLGDMGIALGPKSDNLDRYSDLRDLDIALCTRMESL